MFGAGGILVEVFKDRALGFPPQTTTLARRMMEQTKIYKALQGIRGKPPVDLAALEQLIVRYSQLVAEQHWIKEIDINPLLASPERILALDARIVLHGIEVAESQLPKLAIRPYPSQYVSSWTMKNKREVIFRPIRAEDEPLMIKFHESLSERTVYLRYFYPMKLSQRVEHERLSRICYVDYDREVTLVVEMADPQAGEPHIIAASRLIKIFGTADAEFTILVADAFQHCGLGTQLIQRLVEIAPQEGIERIVGSILNDNTGMLRVTQQMGFALQGPPQAGVMRVELQLPPAANKKNL
jgi:acetyltransferase